MRILFIVHQFMPDFAGGTERVTLNLARAAQADGHWAEVLTVSQGQGGGWSPDADGFLRTVVSGVPVTGLPSAEAPLVNLGFDADAPLAQMAARFLDSRLAFDVAHVMHAFRMTEAAEALRARGVPYVVTATDFFTLCYRINLVRLDGDLCGGPEGGRACATYCEQQALPRTAYTERTARYGTILKDAAAVAAVSPYVAQRLRAEHPGLPVHVIPNGVDLLRFPAGRAARAAGPLRIGYLGTVSEAKGAGLLARAFAEAAPVEAELHLVGPCYEPALAEEVRGLAQRAPIRFEGPVDSAAAPGVLAGFDILAVPSQVPESFSLALHEGFAAGLPVLVSDLGNIAEVIAASGAGLVLPAGDQAAWTRAIAQLAAEPQAIDRWRKLTPLPWRVEEESFLYNQLYHAAATA